MTTNRKRSIDRLLNVNEQKIIKIEKYAKNIENTNDSDSFYVEIKNFLENLRSILDYCANDLADLTNNNLDEIYFPYCHPRKKDGTLKTQAQIENEFNEKMNNFPDVQSKYPDIYTILKNLQGKKWVSRLIQSVNPQKHDNLKELGRRMIRIKSKLGSIKIGGNMHIAKNTKINIKGKQFKGPISLSPDRPIPDKFSNGFENVDTLNEKEYQLFLNEIQNFQKKIANLIKKLYANMS